MTRLEVTLLIAGPFLGALIGYFWAEVVRGLVFRDRGEPVDEYLVTGI